MYIVDYLQPKGERVYFFEPLDEEMSITELQELMDENEKFLLGEIQKMKKEKITEPSVIDKKEGLSVWICEEHKIQNCKECKE